MKKARRVILTAICAALLIGVSMMGTLAFLTDRTPTVTNTFTAGRIRITLTETTGAELTMAPGAVIPKDPRVTVLSGSEGCWLFVKIEKSSNFDAYLSFALAEGWTALDGAPGVYYRRVETAAGNQSFAVLANDQVTVHSALEAALLEAAAQNPPTLAMTAYAVQQAGFPTAAAAWVEAAKLDSIG